ncbi:Sak single strand annealing protein, partial [Lactobacillus crispatus]
HNRALDPKKVTYFEINKTQMRALTKALAFAGLGLNIYAGEDLPSNDEKTPQRKERVTEQELIEKARKSRTQYGGDNELVTDIVGLEIDGDKQANAFLNQWCKKDKKNKNLYKFIMKNQLATHGMKVGA